jgi:hypothetical protein
MNSINSQMKTEEIKKLLERYYDADTTEEEELFLREFFKQDSVPELFIREKEIFNYYDQFAGSGELSKDFEQRIIESVGYADPGRKASSSGRIIITLSAIAAGLIILAATYFFLEQNIKPRDTFSDPEIAYAETMRILTNVSVKLNKGTQALTRVGQMQELTERTINDLSRPSEIIEEKLKPLDRFSSTIDALGSFHEEISN